MKIVDKINECGQTKAYAHVPDELLAFTPGCQVQPAPYVDKPWFKFYFYREDKDGYILRGANGVKYGFDFDQVIIYIDKKTIVSYDSKQENICGYIKKDGTKCLIKSKAGFCRFHK